MEQMADIGIISLFHRGNWLASELSQQGKRVALIDLSSLFPRWTPSDWEGPFGIFRHQDLQESQIFYLFEGESVIDASNGFCLWPKNGPIEFNGPISNLQFKKINETDLMLDYFRALSKSDNLEEKKKEVRKKNFQDVWPIYLSHHLSSLKAYENYEALGSKKALPFLTPYSYRVASRIGLEDALENCANLGVSVYKDCQLEDIIESKNGIESIEISSKGRSFLQKAQKWLIMLTTSELSLLKEKTSKVLHDREVCEPDWAWVRYELEVAPVEELKVLPYHFVTLGDIHAPWFGSNLVIFNRTMKETQFDAWLKIPNAQRFQKQYLEEVRDHLVESLRERLPVFEIKDVEMPQEYKYGFNELGPARFVMYNANKHQKVKRKKWKNVMWSSPEDWEAQDWLNIMRTNQENLLKIKESLENDRKV